MATANHKTRVLLIEDDPDFTALLLTMLRTQEAFELCACSSLAEAAIALEQTPVEVIVSDLNLPDSEGYLTFAHLVRKAAGTPIVVLTSLDDEALALRAVADGAQDFLIKSEIQAAGLLRAIRYALTRSRATGGQRFSEQPKGRILGFIGAKGGVGASTVALNVAAALARADRKVIALEMRPDFGSFSMYLPRAPQAHLGTLIENAAEPITEARLDASLCGLSQGLRVLCSPQDSSECGSLAEEQVTQIVQSAAGLADYVIVDIPRYPAVATIAALRSCSAVTLVVDREPSAIQAVRSTLALIERSGVSSKAVGAVIVNRTALDMPIPIAKVMAATECDLFGVIPPAAQLCAQAHEYRTLLVLLRPDEIASGAMIELAGRLSAPALVPVLA